MRHPHTFYLWHRYCYPKPKRQAINKNKHPTHAVTVCVISNRVFNQTIVPFISQHHKAPRCDHPQSRYRLCELLLVALQRFTSGSSFRSPLLDLQRTVTAARRDLISPSTLNREYTKPVTTFCLQRIFSFIHSFIIYISLSEPQRKMTSMFGRLYFFPFFWATHVPFVHRKRNPFCGCILL